MFMGNTLPFARDYVEEVDQAIRHITPNAGLTRIQQGWLSFCIVAILVTNSICWKRFERASLGVWSQAALSWMFRQQRRFWGVVLRASVHVLVRRYGITKGVLVLDDSEKKRAKQTRRIYKAHKVKDKKSGGFLHGQQMLVLVLVTPTVTLPVGIEFYMADPRLSAWYQEEKRLKQAGVPKAQRPKRPDNDAQYPTLVAIALRLLEEFQQSCPQIAVSCVLADALYGTAPFLDRASTIFGGVQVISQLRENQRVRWHGRTVNLMTWIQQSPGVPQRIRIRGGDEIVAVVSAARMTVCAHGRPRFVIAVKYDGEERSRFLVASTLSWRHLDIVQAHTLRWLVEVFLQDWKAYEGWGQLTKQPDEEGSRRSLILSLLCDHCLLLHPDQLARIEHNLPACTVGSLRDRVKVESLVQFFQEILASADPQAEFEAMARRAKEMFTLNDSGKHMVGRELGRLAPTPSLEYRAQVVARMA